MCYGFVGMTLPALFRLKPVVSRVDLCLESVDVAMFIISSHCSGEMSVDCHHGMHVNGIDFTETGEWKTGKVIRLVNVCTSSL